MNGFWAGLGRGEQLLLGGAALIFVFSDLIVGLLSGAGVGGVVGITAALAIAFVYAQHTAAGGGSGWPFPYPVVLLVLTVIVVVIELEGLIEGLHVGLFANEGALDILATLAAWVGAALMAVGWSMDWLATPRR